MLEVATLTPLRSVLEGKSPFSAIKLPAGEAAEMAGIKTTDATINFMILAALNATQELPSISESKSVSIEDAKKFADTSADVIKKLSAVVQIAHSAAEFVRKKLGGAEAEKCIERVRTVIEKVDAFASAFDDSFTPTPMVRAIGGTSRNILAYLKSNGPTMMTDLAKECGVTTAAITGHGDRLAQFPVTPSSTCALITRATGEDDRRKVIATLTPDGEVVAAQIALVEGINVLLRDTGRILQSKLLA